MKKLCLILLLTISIFSGSFSQSIPKPVIDWCLSVNQQNKDLIKKLATKDSVNQSLEALHASDTTVIGSFERSTKAYEKSDKAYRESSMRKDTVITTLERDVKKANTKTGLSIGALVIVIILSLVF